jgi:hypothetical protein
VSAAPAWTGCSEPGVVGAGVETKVDATATAALPAASRVIAMRSRFPSHTLPKPVHAARVIPSVSSPPR